MIIWSSRMAQALTDMVDKKLKTSSTISVTVYPVSSGTTSTTDVSTFKGQIHDSVIVATQPNQKLTHRSGNADEAKFLRCPKPSLWVKTKEVTTLSQIKLKVRIRDLKEPCQPLSEVQKAIHSHIGPLLKRGGIDDRVLLGSGNSAVEVKHDQGGIQTVIHAGNHNYAGLYKSTEETERLHQICLHSLPVSISVDSTNLESALQAKVAHPKCNTSAGPLKFAIICFRGMRYEERHTTSTYRVYGVRMREWPPALQLLSYS